MAAKLPLLDAVIYPADENNLSGPMDAAGIAYMVRAMVAKAGKVCCM